MKSQLAIVIPYYKIEFFENLLLALVSQTSQDFSVYIGNDCSTDNPEPILKKYYGKLNIRYHRFCERLGDVSVTRQWERCFALIEGESWVWFLPDDDVPSPNCVEEFHRALDTESIENVKLFKFPMNIIDRNGTVTHSSTNGPTMENNYEFYSRVVRGKAMSSLGDNIFRRQSFEDTGGFVEFPKAWGSDHATTLNVASGGVICSLNNASLGFRMSGENISSDMTDGYEKMRARNLFAKWLKTHEHIFPRKPDFEFYQFFYWKGEHYAVHEWNFSFHLWMELYRLRVTCLNSVNPAPVLKLLITHLWHLANKLTQVK
jgi:glycosyltransferase involved in cell wall biosynthesis